MLIHVEEEMKFSYRRDSQIHSLSNRLIAFQWIGQFLVYLRNLRQIPFQVEICEVLERFPSGSYTISTVFYI